MHCDESHMKTNPSSLIPTPECRLRNGEPSGKSCILGGWGFSCMPGPNHTGQSFNFRAVLWVVAFGEWPAINNSHSLAQHVVTIKQRIGDPHNEKSPLTHDTTRHIWTGGQGLLPSTTNSYFVIFIASIPKKKNTSTRPRNNMHVACRIEDDEVYIFARNMPLLHAQTDKRLICFTPFTSSYLCRWRISWSIRILSIRIAAPLTRRFPTQSK